MRARRILPVAVTAIFALIVTGCPSAGLPPEVTGAAKIINGQMSQLTAAEIVALVDTASALSSDINISLTEEEAQEIVNFLVANNINTVSDIEALIDQFIENPSSVEIPPGLIVVVADQLGVGSTPTADTSNQGGGTVGTAMVKVTQGEVSTLTPDEVQLISDVIANLAEAEGLQIDEDISDEEAALIVQFLQLNDIDTIEEWQDIIEQGVADINSIQIPAGAEDYFDGFFENGGQH